MAIISTFLLVPSAFGFARGLLGPACLIRGRAVVRHLRSANFRRRGFLRIDCVRT
jgi:hypothetical protein